MTRWHPVCCQSRWKIRAGPMRRVVMVGSCPLAWAESSRTDWARRAPETRRASSCPDLLELIESSQGGDDPLSGASVLPAVLDDLEVGA